MIKYKLDWDYVIKILDQYLDAHNLTAFEFCKKVGLGTSTISRLRHKKSVSAVTLIILCWVLKINPIKLLQPKVHNN